ncbi:MAG: hypothetical protein U0872_11070 [Planctomycetaceae bacterium]
MRRYRLLALLAVSSVLWGYVIITDHGAPAWGRSRLEWIVAVAVGLTIVALPLYGLYRLIGLIRQYGLSQGRSGAGWPLAPGCEKHQTSWFMPSRWEARIWIFFLTFSFVVSVMVFGVISRQPSGTEQYTPWKPQPDVNRQHWVAPEDRPADALQVQFMPD